MEKAEVESLIHVIKELKGWEDDVSFWKVVRSQMQKMGHMHSSKYLERMWEKLKKHRLRRKQRAALLVRNQQTREAASSCGDNGPPTPLPALSDGNNSPANEN